MNRREKEVEAINEFDRLFMRNMTVKNVNGFKRTFITLYNKVIVPAIFDQISKREQLEMKLEGLVYEYNSVIDRSNDFQQAVMQIMNVLKNERVPLPLSGKIADIVEAVLKKHKQ